MVISTNSWHYRFMKFMGVQPHWRTNLCEYIREFVFAFLKLGSYTTTTALMVACATFVLYSMGYVILGGIFGIDVSTVKWAIGVAFWIAVCAVGAGYVVKENLDCRVYKPSGPFKQYIMDRHNKVCRMIEFN
jgi:hypothetical protein